jgi:pyridoxal phosphate enzyme (YggS family)
MDEEATVSEPRAAEQSAEAAQTGPVGLAGRAREVRARVAAAAARSARPSESVLVIAVTKTVPAETLRDAYALGFHTFGENRVQEARDKREALTDLPARWELIGHLQTNKVARAAELFGRIQSVDSTRLAQELDRRAEALGQTLAVLLEVNVAGEESKSGLALDELVGVAETIAGLAHLRAEGLMTVAPIVERAEEVRPVFRRLHELRELLRGRVPIGPGGGWDELSMGMSDDFEVAVEEGATIVRIGRALFGERPKP